MKRIYLLITNECNLACSMCIRGENQNKKMKLEEFKETFDKEDTSDIEIVITGGEPTLHEDFISFIEYSSKKFKKVLVATNGVISRYINSIKNLDNIMIQISLDGDKEIHNKVRGEGSFEKTIETIKKA